MIAALTNTRNAVGRIGLEFDAHGLCCAQVRKHGTGWRLTHSRSVAVSQSTASGSGDQPSAPFRAADLLLAAAGFRGGEIASVLPMESCELRVLELPPADPAELRMMINNENEAVAADDSVFDFWTLPSGMTTRKDMTGICSLSADRRMIADTVQQVHAGGFTISGIDGLPTACARAVSIMNISDTRISVERKAELRMAVHIGWKRCTLVLVQDGIPLLARVPQVPGLSSFLQSTAESMAHSSDEVLRLMRGLHDGLLIHASPRVMARLHDAVQSWCLPLCEEIMRSIAFSRRPGLRMVPGAVILLGVGSVITGLTQIMSDELNIVVELWRLPADECVRNGPEYAIAAGLSAWEIDA